MHKDAAEYEEEPRPVARPKRRKGFKQVLVVAGLTGLVEELLLEVEEPELSDDLIDSIVTLVEKFLNGVFAVRDLDALFLLLENTTLDMAKIGLGSEAYSTLGVQHEHEIEALNQALYDLLLHRYDKIIEVWRDVLQVAVRTRVGEESIPDNILLQLLDGLFKILFSKRKKKEAFLSLVDGALCINFGQLKPEARLYIADLLWRLVSEPDLPYDKVTEALRTAIQVTSLKIESDGKKPMSPETTRELIWRYIGLSAGVQAFRAGDYHGITTLPIWILIYIIATHCIHHLSPVLWPSFELWVAVHILFLYGNALYRLYGVELIRDSCTLVGKCLQHYVGYLALAQILTAWILLRVLYAFYPHMSVTHVWVELCHYLEKEPPRFLYVIGAVI